MRWLGLARRALDVALDHAAAREAFGSPLLELGMVQALVADSAIEIEASRGLIRTCAEVLDAGGRGGHESSVAKVFVSETVGRVVDRALQMCGGLGATDDLLLARYAREVRGFRIYDGPSETHRWSIARRAARRRARER
jgi:acyl-CoA dehydrogenase